MQIVTRHFGTIEYTQDKVIAFPEGLPGFTQVRGFLLISQPGSEPYRWLQGIELPELAIPVLPVRWVRPDYGIKLSPPDRELLRLTPGEEPLLLGVVVVPENPELATVNLLAPVAINEAARIGAQCINEANAYRTRHLIKDEIRNIAKEGNAHAGTDPEKAAIRSAGR